MNLIFLDDDENRCNLVRKKLPGMVKYAHTAQDCIKRIQEMEEISILFLDHDLGGEVYVDTDREDCGMEVVRWIENNNPLIRNIVVHSMNKPAADEMVQRLQDASYNASYVPFTVLIERIKI